MWAVPVISLVIASQMYPYHLGYDVNVEYVSKLFIGVVLIIIGNYLPKARQNYTIGIRTPWTLANEVNWNKTHRLAGYLWLVCGIVMILLTFAGMMKTSIMIAIVVIIIIVPFLYSFLLHVKKH